MCKLICFNRPISDWLLSLTEVAGISTSATSWALQGKFCRWVNRIPPTNTLSYTKLNYIHQINQVFPIELSLIRLIKDRTQKLVRAVSEFCIYVRLRVKGLFYLIWKYRYLWYKKKYHSYSFNASAIVNRWRIFDRIPSHYLKLYIPRVRSTIEKERSQL